MALREHGAEVAPVEGAKVPSWTVKIPEKLVTNGATYNEVLHGWRGQLVGKRLQALLAGELGLYAHNGAIELRNG